MKAQSGAIYYESKKAERLTPDFKVTNLKMFPPRCCLSMINKRHMEEERPFPPLIIITRVIHKNNSYTTKLGGPIVKHVSKKDYLNLILTLNKI